MIKFRCQSCEKKIAVKDEYAGRRAKCPNCSEPMTIPSPPAAADSAVGLPGGSAAMGALAGLDMPAGGGSLRRMDPPPEAPEEKRSHRGSKPAGTAAAPAPAAASTGMKSHTAIAPPRPTEADVKTCPKCGTAVNASAKLCINCGHGFSGLSAQNRSRMRFASLFVGRSGAALAGGLATALLAGFLWAAVVRYTGFEIGWLAWGLGLGVGFCVALIARQQNNLVGVAAAVVALLGWFAGKVAILYWAVPIIAAAELSSLADRFGGLNNADTAKTLAIEKLHESDILDDETYNGYYEDSLSAEEDARVEKLADDWIAIHGEPDMESEIVEGIRDDINEQPMLDAMAEYGVLGWIDGLWVFLMVGSAWKIGSGGGLGGDD